MKDKVASPGPAFSGAVVGTLALSNLVVPLMGAGVAVTLPNMGRELGMGGGSLGLVETLYLGAIAAFLLPAGQLGDAGDKRSFFGAGMVIFTAATLGLGFAHSPEVVFALRILEGFSAAVVSATNMALLAEAVPRERLGRAIGLNIGAVYLGLTAGPYFAGLLTTAAGWRWMYYAGGGLSFFATAVGLVVLRPRWTPLRVEFDWLGTATSVAAIASLVAGSAMVGVSPDGWLWVLLGGGCLVGFVVVERRAVSPLLPLGVLAERPVLLRGLAAQLLTYAGGFGTTFLFALYLQEAKGWTAAAAGRLLVASPVLMAVLAPIAGRLADRYRPQAIAAVGVVLITGGTLVASLVPHTGSEVALVATLVAHGVGFALFSSPNMAVILTAVPSERTGLASALASAMRTLGMVVSMLLITTFLAVALGEQHIGSAQGLPAFVKAMGWAMASIGGLSLLALLAVARDVFAPVNEGPGRG